MPNHTRTRKTKQPASAYSKRSRARAAAAHTSERVTGEARESVRSILNAGAEGAERSAQQVVSLFGISGERSEGIARRSADTIKAVARASTTVTYGLQDLSQEWLTVVQEQAQRSIDAVGELSRCRSIADLIAVQSELVRENVRQAMVGARRIAEASTRIADEANRSLEQSWRAPQRRAA
jgi:hypothetical protein